jgi:hypothetical protein
MTDERKAELLEQARRIEQRARIEHRMIMDMDPGTFREWQPDWMLALERGAARRPSFTLQAPDILGTDDSSGIDHGQGGSHRRQRRGKPRVRSVSYVDNGRKNPMKDDDDD